MRADSGGTLVLQWRTHDDSPFVNTSAQWRLHNNTGTTLYDVSIDSQTYECSNGARSRETSAMMGSRMEPGGAGGWRAIVTAGGWHEH